MDWKEIIDRKVTILTTLGFMGGLLFVYGALIDERGIPAGMILLLFTGGAWMFKQA